MIFQPGDTIVLTGKGWPERKGTLLPARNSIQVVESADVGLIGGGAYRYRLVGYSRGPLYIAGSPEGPWGEWTARRATAEEKYRNKRASGPMPLADLAAGVRAAKPRAEALSKARELIDGDREGTYGDPLVSHKRIAKLWSAVLDVELTAQQVAMMMALMKVSRLTGNAEHEDSWVDLAGYAALGYEFSVRGDE